jgi:hypothetical protein
MAGDAARVRGTAPVIMSSLREAPQAPDVAAWVLDRVADWTGARLPA